MQYDFMIKSKINYHKFTLTGTYILMIIKWLTNLDNLDKESTMISFESISEKSLANTPLTQDDCHFILNEGDLLTCLHHAFSVRKTFFENKVAIHIINNAQNGSCPEDCGYCPQAKNSKAPIEKYRLKSEFEILEEARQAYESGAKRYCMVSSGRGPKDKRISDLASMIKKIKSKYPIEICVSAGLLDEDKAAVLKEAGLDRLNPNLNTSENHYPKICTTHTYQDRLQTLQAAQKNGLEVCSGIIIGMGENNEDIIKVAQELRQLEAPSIPVNYLVPIKGTQFEEMPNLTPDYCLRILCLFRFSNTKAEIRVAAGRELHFRSMEGMSLYPANSLFLEGYLNTKGREALKLYQMIQDAGFEIESEKSIDEMVKKEQSKESAKHAADSIVMKTLDDLRPAFSNTIS